MTNSGSTGYCDAQHESLSLPRFALRPTFHRVKYSYPRRAACNLFAHGNGLRFNPPLKAYPLQAEVLARLSRTRINAGTLLAPSRSKAVPVEHSLASPKQPALVAWKRTVSDPERFAVLVSNFSLPRRLGKTLLVCSRRCAEVENQLAHVGCRLKRVRDGNKALRTIRYETFDTAILLSTGKQMDLVETILNLRDIRPSMPVIVLIDPASSEPTDSTQAVIADAIPEIPIFTLSEFQTHLGATSRGGIVL